MFLLSPALSRSGPTIMLAAGLLLTGEQRVHVPAEHHSERYDNSRNALRVSIRPYCGARYSRRRDGLRPVRDPAVVGRSPLAVDDGSRALILSARDPELVGQRLAPATKVNTMQVACRSSARAVLGESGMVAVYD